MSNQFNKEERVVFELIMEGFHDQLVVSKNVSVYSTDQVTMERTGDIIWRPQPYIVQSFDGTDQSSNFKNYTQLAVPATINYTKSVPWVLTARELRDALQEKRLQSSSQQRLASDINVAIMNVATMQGTLVVTSSTAATGFDDVAKCDAIMNEQGVMSDDRYLALSTRDYNNMASNLQVASRSFNNPKSVNAYEKAYVGNVAGFETFKLDYAQRLAAAAGGSSCTISTLATGGNVFVPRATLTEASGARTNVDNRFQTVTLAAGSANIAAGDCFTIAGVNSVHHITKRDTGQLKTFRVIQKLSSTSLVISPPLITGQGGTDAELQYQNCVVNTASATSAITWLNIAAANMNPFWYKDSLELLPGRYAVPTDSGVAVLRASTDQGIEVVMQKFYDVKTMTVLYRLDMLFGVVNKQPEMTGIMLFSQT